MASVTLRLTYADGTTVAASVKAATSYPDALHEATTEALHAVRQMAVMVTEVGPEEQG